MPTTTLPLKGALSLVIALAIWAPASQCRAATTSADVELSVTAVIENEVSQKQNWAAGSFHANPKTDIMLKLTTRPKDGDLFSEKPSTLEDHDSKVLWVPGTHTKTLDEWLTSNGSGKRIYVKVRGEFIVQTAGGGGSTGGGGSGGGGPPWYSNSLDVDIDTGAIAGDNPPPDDKKEMDPGQYTIHRGDPGDSMLRKLPPQVKEKLAELKPTVVIRRTHDGVDLLENGASIFLNGGLISKDMTQKILDKELHLTVKGTVKGDVVFTVVLTFTDPSSGYPYEFLDAIRVTIEGKPRVDIDVDWNRNGKVEDDPDDPQEDAPIDFLADSGALMLVNCDDDSNPKSGTRDMEDNIITNKADEDDMSPVSIELEEDLSGTEEIWLVMENVSSPSEKPWCRFMDPTIKDPTAAHEIVGYDISEVQIYPSDFGGKPIFPDGKKHRYDKRFLLEGMRFAEEIAIHLEIRDGGTVLERDTVHILNCPWLANNNTQPLVGPAAHGIPGNMTNSTTYGFANGHGAILSAEGTNGEFVQDTAEWGFQVRRQNPPQDSRTMVTALKLHTPGSDEHPRTDYLNGKVGVYGYWPKLDEQYYEKVTGDQGGNLECLPPNAGYPFGRVVHGDTMSQTLRKFLAKQKVQVRGGAVVLNISSLQLEHVDEMICIVPIAQDQCFVAMPDWKLGLDLMRANRAVVHNIDVVSQSKRDVSTYGGLLDDLNTKEGKGRYPDYQSKVESIQQQVASSGAKVVKMPGLFLRTNSGHGGQNDVQRGFPRNPANSQPTIAKKLIVSAPPEETSAGKARESVFLKSWKSILTQNSVTGETEDATNAWAHLGEVHCSSNGIREPIKK